MRTIKFRLWDSVKEEMIIPQDVINLEGELSKNLPTGLIPLQFTGLTDKNGKEIYEGDIVTFHKGYVDDTWTDTEQGLPYVIEWYQRECKFYAKRNNNYLTPVYNSISTKHPWTWEVIGNIYETPEKLKS